MEVSYKEYEEVNELSKKGIEIWKEIQYSPTYHVSNLGRIKNTKTGKILSTPVDPTNGYCCANIYKDKKGKTFDVHLLEARAFIPNPENKRLVNHIDTDKTNNRLYNLEWNTDSENMLHAFANGLCENTRKAAKIQQEKLSKLPRTQKQIDTARENIIKINKRPKTEKQLEAARKAINSPACRESANEKHMNRHPPIRLIETGEVFRSQKELAEKLGMNESAICAYLHGRRKNYSDFHFEYVKQATSFLYDYQLDAVNRMRNGCILCGSVGSGKSRTALFYYFKEQGGWIDKDEYTPMNKPKDLYIITPAKKRDSKEWLGELANFALYPDEKGLTRFGNKIVVDSWNNLPKYKDVENAFFLLDEQRLVSYGSWTKTFLQIAKVNNWILLSATPADSFSDLLPVFLANGFYKNKTEFNREHVVFSRYAKFPKIEKYVNTRKLDRLRDRIMVDMDYKHDIQKFNENVYCSYDVGKYKEAIRTRWNPYKEQPIQDAGGLCYVLRRIVNEDQSRQVKLLEIIEDHPKVLIFYNFDYERDILLNLAYPPGTEVAEWSGHRHQPAPVGKKWVYICQYNACEGWELTSTNCVVFYSQNYSYKVVTQAAGRVDRLNTPYNELFYFHLKSRSGIDLAISRALHEKRKFNERRWCKWD